MRKVLIGATLLSFIYFSTVFIYQYRKYRQVKEQLNAAYAAGQSKSSALYRLFSTYGEADNLFRLYTIDFNDSVYREYTSKLDTISHDVDSLLHLPIPNGPLKSGPAAIKQKNYLAREYASLKRNVNELIYFAQDSLPALLAWEDFRMDPALPLDADTTLSRTLRDTVLLNLRADTLVQKKGNLIQRIFNAKNDTLIFQNKYEQVWTTQLEVILRNLHKIILQKHRAYDRNVMQLQRNYSSLRQKERELIQANYTLLKNLKEGFDNIIALERSNLQHAEQLNLALHEENARIFGSHLLTALVIMFFMIMFILFYQYNAGQYERKLNFEKEHTSRLAEEKTSVLANVSHEVRAPLESLIGVVDILKKEGVDQHIEPQFLDAISYEITMINSTVTDILNLSKMEIGALSVKYEYFSPRFLLQDLILLHTYHAEKKGLRILEQLNVPADLEIYSSAFRIKQIISNLLTNAIKYTATGTVSLSCIWAKRNRRQELIIKVADTGVGIAAAQQRDVFRQYYTAEAKNRKNGFGLGLYISKLLTQQLQGNLTLASTPGKGSTFTLRLPIEKSRQSLENTKKRQRSDLPQNMRIVLIEDNRINLIYLQHFFKDFPHVYSFENGKKALDFIRTEKIDLIITDLHMPETNGWDILQFVRTHSHLSNIPVLAFTADDLAIELAHLRDPGDQFDDILSKPFDEQEVVCKILKALGS